MQAWTVRYSPKEAVLAVLVGRVIVREAPATLDGASLTFRGRSFDAVDHRLGRWQHPRCGGLGSFIEVHGPSGRLRLGCDRLCGDDRYSTAPSSALDGQLDRNDFDALLAAMQAVHRRARGEPQPTFRAVDRGPRTLVLRSNGWKATWRTPALMLGIVAACVGLGGLGSLLVGEVALVAAIVAMPLAIWSAVLFGSGPGPTGTLVVHGFNLSLDVGDGTSLTVDARYLGVEAAVHQIRGRARFDFPLVRLRPPLSEQAVTIGTDDLRLGWNDEMDPGPAATWLVGPAEWRLLLRTLNLDSLIGPDGGSCT